MSGFRSANLSQICACADLVPGSPPGISCRLGALLHFAGWDGTFSSVRQPQGYFVPKAVGARRRYTGWKVRI